MKENNSHKKIRVCHMTSAHPPEDIRIFHKECVSLAEAGYEVYLVERGESYDKNGVHIVGVGDIPNGRLKRMTKGAKCVYEKALALDCEIYHFHDPELLPYGLKLKEKGKKVVFDSHENTADAILEKGYIPSALRRLIHSLYSSYQNVICKHLDAVITVTPSMTREFQKLNPHVLEVRNYPKYMENTDESQREEKRLAFAGGISEQWNHHVLLRAMEKIPECRYCLCGVSDSEDYLYQLQTMPAWDRVEFRGKIPHAEVSKVLKTSGIGVALLRPGTNTDGRNGTMGNTKIFEEMMAGLPVICTNFTLWKEFIDRYQCGICVNPSDPDEIAQAISFLFANNDKAAEMGQNGRTAIKKEFNWEIEQYKLLTAYKELVVN